MKRFVSLMLTVFLVFSIFTVASAGNWGEEYKGDNGNKTLYYSDVTPDHWAYDETKRCKEKAWFDGYPDGTFRPDKQISRAEAIKVIVSFMGRKIEEITHSNYHDVDVNDWYAPFIHAGADLFPSKWNNNNAFQPDKPMTREDTIYALVVALGYQDKTKVVDQSVLNMFDDKSSITNTVRPYVAFAVNNGMVSGYDDNTIRGQDPLTRAQFAALLSRASNIAPSVNVNPVINKVSVSPSSKQSLKVGESFTFSGKATYSDNTVKTYSELNPYDSDYSGVVRIDGNKITAVKKGLCEVKFNCDYLKDVSVVINVENPSDAPVIKISSYPKETESEYAEIEGTVKDITNTNVKLTCNRDSIRLNGEYFSYRVKLSIGRNELEFVAENEYGNESTKSIVIYRQEPEPTTVEVESVVGKSESYAKSVLESLGLRVRVETAWDDNVSSGTVIEQSIDAGREVEIGSTVTITVSGGKNEWVEWSETLPSYVNNNNYIIEKKTQYRYRELETKWSSSSYLSGWNLEKEDTSTGGWSSWSTSPVSSSSTREVETKSVADPQKTKTQWHYTRYYGIGASGKYVSWPWQGTYSKTYQESGWRDSPMENRGKGDGVNATVYKDPNDPISIWWWNETTRTVNLPTTYHTEYRYRDKVSSYLHSRWGEWCDWSDSAVSENGTREVETREVYRYKFK